MTDIHQARAQRWLPSPPVSSIERAARFVEDVGLALVFPAERVEAPSLWEAVAGEDAEPFADGMGEAESLVWDWKDELPHQSLAWYGKFLFRRGSFLSLPLLRALYPGRGRADDHKALDITRESHDVADALRGGPMTTAALRQLVGDRSRYDRAMGELHRSLVVTSAGVEPQRSGWPSARVELTCRLFDVGGARDHGYAAERFLDTIMRATPRELARAYGWPVPEARSQLEALVARDLARGDEGGSYVAHREPSGRRASRTSPSTRRR